MTNYVQLTKAFHSPEFLGEFPNKSLKVTVYINGLHLHSDCLALKKYLIKIILDFYSLAIK